MATQADWDLMARYADCDDVTDEEEDNREAERTECNRMKNE